MLSTSDHHMLVIESTAICIENYGKLRRIEIPQGTKRRQFLTYAGNRFIGILVTEQLSRKKRYGWQRKLKKTMKIDYTVSII